jgi:ATP-dependent RNA helicase DeaD
VSPLTLPTVQAVNDVRIAKFKDQISETLAAGELEVFTSLIEDFEREKNIPVLEIAAALAKMARGEVPLLLDKNRREPDMESESRPARPNAIARPERERTEAMPRRERSPRMAEQGMATWRIEVGHSHGVKPGNIVGAIANEAELESEYIGRIEIFDDHSTVDLPEGMPKELLKHLKTVWVSGQRLQISKVEPAGQSSPGGAGKRRPTKDKGGAARPEMRLETKSKSKGAPPSKSGARRPPSK